MNIFSWLKSLFKKSKDAPVIDSVYMPPKVWPPAEPKREPGDDAVMARVAGIDVSKWQGEIDWKKVAASGVRFVFIKATQGTTFVDKYFYENYKGAKAAGLLVGAYHFLVNDNDGYDQARHFLRATDGLNLDLPLVMDWEIDGCDEEARGFLSLIGNRKCIIYGGHIIKGEKLGNEFLKYPLWLSHYGVKIPTLPKPWTKFTFWQYSDSGTVPGIKGKCDLNWFNGTLDELRGMK